MVQAGTKLSFKFRSDFELDRERLQHFSNKAFILFMPFENLRYDDFIELSSKIHVFKGICSLFDFDIPGIRHPIAIVLPDGRITSL